MQESLRYSQIKIEYSVYNKQEINMLIYELFCCYNPSILFFI